MSLGAAVQRQPKSAIVTVSILAVALIGWIDYLTGWEWSLFIFYAFPIGLVVWKTGRGPGLATAILCTGAWCAANLPTSPYQTSWGFLLAAGSRLFYFGVVVAAVGAVKETRELDRARIEALERAQEAERTILRANERKNRDVGQELHDGLGPHLAAIGYAATFLADELRERDQPEAEKAGQIRDMTGKALSLVRGLARGIFPVQMDGSGLSTALEELAGTTSELTGVPISFLEKGNTSVADPEASMHLFRIAQEAMTNALKHGRSKAITIALTRDENSLRLVVADDGDGMDSSRSGVRSLGLRSMKYRARALGAELKIESKPDEGTIVSCEIPNARPASQNPAS